MPKIVFENGKLSVVYDPDDPNDAYTMEKEKFKGKLFTDLAQAEKDELLTVLVKYTGIIEGE